MNKALQISILVFSGLVLTLVLPAQTNDVGAIGSLSLSKEIGKSWDVKLEQEFRFNNDITTFDRSLTSIGVNYTLIKKRLNVELDYDYIQQRQDAYFELRQRSSLALSAQTKIRSFDFEFRTRGQAVWRDESRGDYKFNPKYVWRNKLDCSYTIFGSPLKPFVSTELFCPLNSENGFYLNGLRATAGIKYRIDTRTSIQFLVRYDQDLQQTNPKSVFYGGMGWNYKI